MDCHGANSEKIVQSNQPFPLFNGLVSLPPKTFEKLNVFGLSGKYVHEPANVSCAFCHDAHASDYPEELYAPVTGRLSRMPRPQCRRIIRSEQPIPLLGGQVIVPPKTFKTLTELNLAKFGHPVARHPVYVPATADKPELNCASCHNSHSTPTGPKRLLAQQQELCARCHEM